MRRIRNPQLYRPSSSSDDVDDEAVIQDIAESQERRRELERRRALEMNCPNEHFYRNLPVGEHPRYGPWLPSEKEIFLNRLQELEGNDVSSSSEWGYLSRGIPGRTGYQCMNFYRELLRNGELSSSDYQEPPPSPVSDVPLPIFMIPMDSFRVRPSQSVVEASPDLPLLEPPPAEPLENPFPPGEPLDVDPVLDLDPRAPQRSRRMSVAEKVRVIELRHTGNSFHYIAGQLDRSPSACSRFYDLWTSSEQLQRQLGRPRIPAEIAEHTIEETRVDRRSTLRTVGSHVGVSPETVRRVRHGEGFHYYDCIAVPPLKPEAKQKRVAFASHQIHNNDGLPIIFTDESMMVQNLNPGGVWRKRGEIIDEGFYERDHHPISVMVWGAIGVDFHGPLVRCPGSVNQHTYRAILEETQIFNTLTEQFGERGFWWQQDNAPPHQPVGRELARKYLVMQWPPYSPDLSPIEQMWAIIKKKLQGRRFANEDELFDAILQAWSEISQDMINNLCSSFKARCQICFDHGGDSLNGHWTEVHNLHHPHN